MRGIRVNIDAKLFNRNKHISNLQIRVQVRWNLNPHPSLPAPCPETAIIHITTTKDATNINKSYYKDRETISSTWDPTLNESNTNTYHSIDVLKLLSMSNLSQTTIFWLFTSSIWMNQLSYLQSEVLVYWSLRIAVPSNTNRFNFYSFPLRDQTTSCTLKSIRENINLNEKKKTHYSRIKLK